ncbi:MAG: division/cell wall cluster transcriptional repressor MraZ [Candidatus Vogelbacteria bacterium]|nr:division/cell wall cluster transcriptional repressor MraZ [Candidatus Vogelbacteria bacterium]
MLIGEYKHSLDPKKRIAIPAKWRKELGKQVVITYGLDKCLSVYPLKQWAKVMDKVGQMNAGQADTRSFNRFLLGGAVESGVDSIGRVLIPDFLKEYAGLGSHVVLAGIHNRLEIWDEERWGEYKGRVAKRAEALAEKLGEAGLF